MKSHIKYGFVKAVAFAKAASLVLLTIKLLSRYSRTKMSKVHALLENTND